MIVLYLSSSCVSPPDISEECKTKSRELYLTSWDRLWKMVNRGHIKVFIWAESERSPAAPTHLPTAR